MRDVEMTHEFCPRCEANLTLQKGYRNDLPFWICKGCQEMLINPLVETETDIAWICDGCGQMLNIQRGFSEDFGVWKCTECGFENKIDVSELYLSEDEYQEDLLNPYRGMPEAEVLEILSYEEIEKIPGHENIIIVQDDEGQCFVKKILSEYDIEIYRYLMKHPISHMPKLVGIYENKNYLIVLEEYIHGRTLLELINEKTLEQTEALRIARELCYIVRQLHTLDRPVIHRDIKASNVMISDSGEVILLDVNAAKWYKPDACEDTVLMGTQGYAAPEQLGYGELASSERTDVYAIGVLLNVMITGKFPKEKATKGNIKEIIKRCMKLEPQERYSVMELIQVLELGIRIRY